MKTRTLVVMGVLFVALVAVVAFLLMDESGSEGDSSSTSSSLGIAGFTKDSTSEVSIARAGAKPLVLTREDGTWKVAGKAANAKQVDAFFKGLGKLDKATLVSKNPDNHDRLGATKAAGTTLVLTKDGTKTTYIVGNGADSAGSFYVKRDGEDEVWQVVAADFQVKLGQDAKAWQTAPSDGAPEVGGQPAMPGQPGGLPPGMGAPPGA